jgi:hypothetical protein
LKAEIKALVDTLDREHDERKQHRIERKIERCEKDLDLNREQQQHLMTAPSPAPSLDPSPSPSPDPSHVFDPNYCPFWKDSRDQCGRRTLNGCPQHYWIDIFLIGTNKGQSTFHR